MDTSDLNGWKFHQLHQESQAELITMFAKLHIALPQADETVETVCLRYGTEFTRNLMLLVQSDMTECEELH